MCKNSNDLNKKIQTASKEKTQELLTEIVTILRRAHPPKKNSFFARLYDRVSIFVKYVGIPALTLAVILPIYNLTDAIIDYRNSRIFGDIYEKYAISLMEHGEIDRAKAVMKLLDKRDLLNVRAQYLRCRILITTAIRQGRDHDKAVDHINLLLNLHEVKDFLFPSLGGEEEVFRLRLGLVDIDIQLQKYEEARSKLTGLSGSRSNSIKPDRFGEIELRLGTIDVLTYKHDGARKHLNNALRIFQSSEDKRSCAEAYFQLGKNYQFTREHKEAVLHYNNAKVLWESLSDEWALLKVYNNLAMIQNLEGRRAKAHEFYEKEIDIARRLDDDLSLARGLVNIASIEMGKGNYEIAIKYVLEATEAFRRQGNRLGLATAWGQLARIYEAKGEKEKVIYYGEKALSTFADVEEYNMLALTFSILGHAVYEFGDQEDAVFYLLASYSISTHRKGMKVRGVQTMLKRGEFKLIKIYDEIGVEKFRSLVMNARDKFFEFVSASKLHEIELVVPIKLKNKIGDI